jgi:hypothetical protein
MPYCCCWQTNFHDGLIDCSDMSSEFLIQCDHLLSFFTMVIKLHTHSYIQSIVMLGSAPTHRRTHTKQTYQCCSKLWVPVSARPTVFDFIFNVRLFIFVSSVVWLGRRQRLLHQGRRTQLDCRIRAVSTIESKFFFGCFFFHGWSEKTKRNHI